MSDLETSYRRCKSLNRRFGKTYYYSTLLLPPESRPHVHAIYGFCRYVDDVVDVVDGGTATSQKERLEAVERFASRFFCDLASGSSNDPILAAVVNTAIAYDIEAEKFERFINSMKMDFEIDRYDTFDDLMVYMDGSAAVIGEMMLPILGASEAEAILAARELGIAFQLTNFLRDIEEDLGRGRIYVPQSDIRAFGAENAFSERRATEPFKLLMRYEIARTRVHYQHSLAGDDHLTGRALDCIRAARQLYSGILERIELVDYDVFSGRAKVPALQKFGTIGRLALSRV
ncbi:MAG: phytoene/squalene synthase family protein [Actinomycetota bacterium]|nr:phytoene/squalene synthase family protein [Actinomycetota bacterium]MDA8208793.1 phytoene/squalene synthase family protein [Actinomycetota bacterium]